MVAHEGASLVGLTVNVHGIEGFVQSLVKWPILPVELLAHCHLKFMDPCLLNIINELDLHTLRKSEDILPSPGFASSQQQLPLDIEQAGGWTLHQAKSEQGV